MNGSKDDEAIDAEWKRIQEEDQYELGNDDEDKTRMKRSAALRRKRATVTSNFRSGHGGQRTRFGGRYPVYSRKG